MDILPQILSEFRSNLAEDSSLYQEIGKLISTVYQNPGVTNYVELIKQTDKEFRKKALTLIKQVLEKADMLYRCSAERKQLYYVKQTRSRTIITVFGDLTYKRTEYIDKDTKAPFCYVDWKFDIRKRERYDPCVQALIIDGYADNNSMIKVGKIVGDRISGAFNTSIDGNTAIPRQTVRKIILRHQNLKEEVERVDNTPDILYIMADEKFIHLQGEIEKTGSEMVKTAVIFEDIRPVKRKDGSNTKRNQIINKTIVANSNIDFWDTVIDVLYKKYDMKKVKKVYLMGDGGSWIKAGVDLLKHPNYKVKFGIDSFHFNQAVKRISLNRDVCRILADYARHDLKKEFKHLVRSTVETYPEREEIIQQNIDYIMNHWNYYQISINEIEIGCPMEQAIAHVLASVFTSVAKAYGRKHLPTYVNNRIIQQNNYDMRTVVLNKISRDSTDYQEFDFSIFEKKNYPNRVIHDFNQDVITKF